MKSVSPDKYSASASYRKPQEKECNSSLVYNTFFYFWLRWVFVAVHGLFSGCGEQGLLFVALHGLLTAVASLFAEHGL